MKTKKFTKKLALNKKNIANLNGNAMTKVIGGANVYTWEHKLAISVCLFSCHTCTGLCC